MGETRKLSKEKIEKLESIPGWSWNQFGAEGEEESDAAGVMSLSKLRWPENLSCRLAEGSDPAWEAEMENLKEVLEGQALHHWVDQQRQAYSPGKLSKDKMEELERLPE